MSAAPAPASRPAAPPCPLCGRAVGADDARCPECGRDLGGVGDRPGPFTARALWWSAGGFLAVYLLVLAVVALIR